MSDTRPPLPPGWGRRKLWCLREHSWPALFWYARQRCCGSTETFFIPVFEPAYCPTCGEPWSRYVNTE